MAKNKNYKLIDGVRRAAHLKKQKWMPHKPQHVVVCGFDLRLCFFLLSNDPLNIHYDNKTAIKNEIQIITLLNKNNKCQ